MTTPPLDLNQNDLDTIRLIADGGSRNDVMTIKNTSVLALLNRVEAGESARDHWEKVARGALARAEAAERDLAAVTVSRDGWKTRAEAAERDLAAVRELHKSVPVYTTEAGDCEHDGDCEAVEISAGSYCPVHTDGLTCNECAELAEHADDLPAHPCPTITALDNHAPETETP